jgi:hypothetical protein
MKQIHNLVGQQFEKLTVISLSHRKTPHTYWHCVCKCGGKTIASTNNLRRGRHASCGCTSGVSKNPLYYTWYNMMLRCGYIEGYPAAKSYEGITICDRWLQVENFILDMGNKPSAKHSIDRIDSSKGYFPENCRWATKTQQARNRRCVVNVTLEDGTVISTWDYAEMLGKSTKAAWQIAKRKGMLSKPTAHYIQKLIEVEETKP